MNMGKNLNNKVQGNYLKEELPQIHSSETDTSSIENFKTLYPSILKADYRPSMESVEQANGLNSAKCEPGPADFKKFKRLYLPDSKANYQPTEENIEQANGLKSTKPNILF